ncbi:MAG: tetratricopeptide repeat protein, partial [Acidobacteria bacterium]|nr:tetratricopeptide repeat protein [Acidobacteriota bacterium]
SLDRKVAIKFLPEEVEQDPKARKRFMREARAAAALDHPYICSIHEVGEAEDKPYIVMEYVEGETLRDRIARSPFAADEAVRIALEVAEALQKAHREGIIHRDLKPANIMLTRGGHAKVMDFGLAKQIAGGASAETAQEESLTALTREGATVGTLAYMSPEQLQGSDLDARSDIFSFGIVLYEMLAGVHPFKKDAPMATAAAIMSDSLQPLRRLVRGIPAALEQVLARMLAKQPEQRFQSMHEVQAELAELVRAPGAGRAVVPLLRPLWLAGGGLLLVFALAGAVWWVMENYFKSPAAALAFEARDWILIADFDNQTGEDVFDGSLETAVTVGIQQSQYVNVFPRTRIQETLRRMRRTEVTRIDESIARDVALREGIKGLLACSISKVGEEYLLAARIVDPVNTVTVFSHALRARGRDMVLSALDELAQTVREKLGESLTRMSDQDMPLLQATTSSLEALKLFSEARRAGGGSAPELLRRAIELDPDFALAHATLGFQLYVSNDRVRGDEHFETAMRLLDRLTSREKLYIQALVADWRGRREEGIEKYRAYLAQYPDDSWAWFRLGYAYLITGQFPPGIEAFRRVIELDPQEAAAYVNLATCYGGLKDDSAAVENYEKTFAINPDMMLDTNINHEYGFTLVRMGRVDEAAGIFGKMTQAGSPEQRARGERSTALLLMYQGRYGAARSRLAEAVLLDQAGSRRLSEYRDRLYLSSLLLMKGQKEEFEKQIAEAWRIQETLSIEPAFLHIMGRIHARRGDRARATRLLDLLRARMGDVLASSGINRSNQTDRAHLNLLQGEVELMQGQYDAAIQSFGLAAGLGRVEAQECLAYAYAQQGDLDSAIARYQEFLQADVLGGERQEAWILAHYHLGTSLERQGKPAEARKYYERFLEIWREADPDLAPVQDARKRLAALPPNPA